MCYIIIRYSNQCFAEQSYLFSSFFSLIFSPETTILEKREERIEKSEENKRNDNLLKENCRFFLVEARGVEPLSENAYAQPSTSVGYVFLFPCRPIIDKVTVR